MKSTSGIFSSLAALGLLAALVFALYSLAVAPFLDRAAVANDEIAQERVLLGRYLAEARQATSMPPESSALGAAAFLEGSSDAERIAGLQAHIDRLSAASDLSVLSTQALPERTEGGLRIVSIQAHVSGRIDQLQRLLYEVEAGRPDLVVESLDITRSPVAPGSPEGALDMRLVVAGAAPGPDGG